MMTCQYCARIPREICRAGEQTARRGLTVARVHLPFNPSARSITVPPCEMASLVLIFCAVLCPAFVQANTFCDSPNTFYNQQYSTLFSKLEESLLSNKTLLDNVRHIFMSTESVEIDFSIQLQLDVNSSNLSSCESQQDNDYSVEFFFDFDTFCPSNSTQNVWELCNIPDQFGNTLHMTYSSQTLSKLQWESERQKVDEITIYISHLHGSLLADIFPFFWFGYDSEYGTGDYNDGHGSVSMNLTLERLDCNPPITLTKCVVSELLSWVCCMSGKFKNPCLWLYLEPWDNSLFECYCSQKHLSYYR